MLKNAGGGYGDYVEQITYPATMHSCSQCYPPDLQEDAVETVLALAELFCAGWV